MESSRPAWRVEVSHEFRVWWHGLDHTARKALAPRIRLIREQGPALGYPYSSQIQGSRFGRLRELRVQHAGRPYRLLYAFDHRRVAILLVGGDKGKDDRWYERMVPRAEAILERHLSESGGE